MLQRKRCMFDNWMEFSREIQNKWKRLTDEDLEVIQYDFNLLSERLQKRYGMSKFRAKKECRELQKFQWQRHWH